MPGFRDSRSTISISSSAKKLLRRLLLTLAWIAICVIIVNMNSGKRSKLNFNLISNQNFRELAHIGQGNEGDLWGEHIVCGIDANVSDESEDGDQKRGTHQN